MALGRSNDDEGRSGQNVEKRLGPGGQNVEKRLGPADLEHVDVDGEGLNDVGRLEHDVGRLDLVDGP